MPPDVPILHNSKFLTLHPLQFQLSSLENDGFTSRAYLTHVT